MTITFENDNDVIVYALEKVISYARRTQQIFVAQCVWWLASVIGLQQGLESLINNLQRREAVGVSGDRVEILHPNRIPNIQLPKAVSPVPRDLTEDQRLDRILESAERVIQGSLEDRSRVYRNRVNPLPTTKIQLKKARKVKRLQEENRKKEVERDQRLQEIRAEVIRHHIKE
jgi:hypothetical protein